MLYALNIFTKQKHVPGRVVHGNYIKMFEWMCFFVIKVSQPCKEYTVRQ